MLEIIGLSIQNLVALVTRCWK